MARLLQHRHRTVLGTAGPEPDRIDPPRASGVRKGLVVDPRARLVGDHEGIGLILPGHGQRQRDSPVTSVAGPGLPKRYQMPQSGRWAASRDNAPRGAHDEAADIGPGRTPLRRRPGVVGPCRLDPGRDLPEHGDDQLDRGPMSMRAGSHRRARVGGNERRRQRPVIGRPQHHRYRGFTANDLGHPVTQDDAPAIRSRISSSTGEVDDDLWRCERGRSRGRALALSQVGSSPEHGRIESVHRRTGTIRSPQGWGRRHGPHPHLDPSDLVDSFDESHHPGCGRFGNEHLDRQGPRIDSRHGQALPCSNNRPNFWATAGSAHEDRGDGWRGFHRCESVSPSERGPGDR